MIINLVLLVSVITSYAAEVAVCNRYCYAKNKKYTGTMIGSHNNVSRKLCSVRCLTVDGCAGFNFHEATAECELIDGPGSLVEEAGVTAASPLLCTGK